MQVTGVMQAPSTCPIAMIKLHLTKKLCDKTMPVMARSNIVTSQHAAAAAAIFSSFPSTDGGGEGLPLKEIWYPVKGPANRHFYGAR